MSTEKMIMIRSLGFAVPQSAISALAVCRKEESGYDMPQLSVEANPLVVFSRSMSYYLYLAIDPKYVPSFIDAEDEDEDEAEEEVVEEKPKRRGRKPTVVEEPVVEKPRVYLIHIHSDALDTDVETTLGQSKALSDYIGGKQARFEKVRKNMGFLQKYVNEMNASMEAMNPDIPEMSNFMPPDLQGDLSRHSQSGIDAHADQMRKSAENARAKYDRVIEWFRERVLVRTSGDAEAVNITSDIPKNVAAQEAGDSSTQLTHKKLDDLIRAELSVIF